MTTNFNKYFTIKIDTTTQINTFYISCNNDSKIQSKSKVLDTFRNLIKKKYKVIGIRVCGLDERAFHVRKFCLRKRLLLKIDHR